MTVAAGAVLAVQLGNGTTGWDAAEIGSASQPGTLVTTASWAAGAAFGIDTTNASATYSGNLTLGSIGFAKEGANILTLTGINSWSGGTQVNGGALSVATTAALPYYNSTGSVSVAAGATLAVQLNPDGVNGWSSPQVGNLLTDAIWAPGAAFGIDTTNASAAYAGNITGGMALTKLGGNTLTLTGANVSYTGPTTISSGTLQFSVAANQTLQRRLTGPGALATAGPGTLTLTSTNSYTGGTQVAAGGKLILGPTPMVLPCDTLVNNYGSYYQGSETIFQTAIGTGPVRALRRHPSAADQLRPRSRPGGDEGRSVLDPRVCRQRLRRHR